MFTNLGGAVANILSLSTFLVAALFMSDETFAAWGWRVPFLISIVLVAVGLYVRLKLEETPVFANEAKQRGTIALQGGVLQAVEGDLLGGRNAPDGLLLRLHRDRLPRQLRDRHP
jgi:MFS family permease